MKRGGFALLTALAFVVEIDAGADGWTVTAIAVARAQIAVSKARIGCLDIQTEGNMTEIVGRSCNGKWSCDYKAPTENQYKRMGVHARTRAFCTQGMEITYQCGHDDFHTVKIAGDAWKNPPAHLVCAPPHPVGPGHVPTPGLIAVSGARIGCLDIQTDMNLTRLVANVCNDRKTCSYKAPTEEEYKRAGVQARTRTFCSQAMEITYQCGHADFHTVRVPGDAWDQPPAVLDCNAPAPPTAGSGAPDAIRVTKARIGCLDIQTDGNLTSIVGQVCNDRPRCSYKAPTEEEYKRAGVHAATRSLCSQAMEITYRCGQNDDQTVTVEGDAWDHAPAQLACDGKTISENRQGYSPPPPGTPAEPACVPPTVWVPDPGAATEYIPAPSQMLDWKPTQSRGDYTMVGFRPPHAATRDVYRSKPGDVQGAPGSTLGANEGRLRPELREVAREAKKDPRAALCRAALRFTRNRPAPDSETPSDHDFGNAFADLSVTGRTAFGAFTRLRPTLASLRALPDCAGASRAAIDEALDRAYQVAAALRLPHNSSERRALHWIAVSGEDDQPYRPVNVSGTSFPQFLVRVAVPRWNLGVNTRYLIAHRTAPAFQHPATPLVDGGTPRRVVPADALPALADDAQVILFIHGMDSRAEEAEDLTRALHHLPDGKNWTVLSLDLPTSGYADNIDPGRIGPASGVSCHATKILDFIEDFIVAFVDTVDHQLQGRLKPRIRAVVGGSLGGNMSMRLGRRDDLARRSGKTPDTPWITHVVSWSPAAIWPSMIARPGCAACGCDTGWDEVKDRAVNLALRWSGRSGGGERFLPENETDELRREFFYGSFDWNGGLLVEIFSGKGHKAQAECWFSDRWSCKQAQIAAARIDRQETYDANFRAWHWRLGAEQLAFSHRQNTRLGMSEYEDPLYLYNRKPMLLFCGAEDVCGDLCKHTQDVARRMLNTPGYARFLDLTGHSLDNEHPTYIAKEIAAFVSAF